MNQEIAEAILNWEDHEEIEFFEEVTEEEITDQSRWSTSCSRVYKDKRDESFWELSWTRGSTELQDNGTEDIEFQRVMPQEVTVIKYVPWKVKE
jgi:hypothetical protein